MVRVVALVLWFWSSTPDLQSCARFWQRQLQLEDWRLTVRVVNRLDLKDGTQGDIEPDRSRRRAVIRVLREEDYTLPPHEARAEQELTVAHEMVHLSRLSRGDRQWQDESSTVEETYRLLQKYRRHRELSVAEP